MKKISYVLILAMLLGVFALSGCGGAEPSVLDGKWIGVGAEMMGIKIPVAEVFGGEFSINILGQGKAEVMAGEVSERDKWTLEEGVFTLKMNGADCIGCWDEEYPDVIVFENMLESGIDIIFAKEGSEAADPALYDNIDEILQAIG